MFQKKKSTSEDVLVLKPVVGEEKFTALLKTHNTTIVYSTNDLIRISPGFDIVVYNCVFGLYIILSSRLYSCQVISAIQQQKQHFRVNAG